MTGRSMSAFLCVDRSHFYVLTGHHCLWFLELTYVLNAVCNVLWIMSPWAPNRFFSLAPKTKCTLKTWLLHLYRTPSLLQKCVSFVPSVKCIGFLENRFFWEPHMRWVCVRCELLLNFVLCDRFWCRGWMVMLHFYCIPIHAVTHCGSAMKSKLSLTLSATLIFLHSFSVSTILKFHPCNHKNLTHSSPC
jgi:hypothetical protein